MFGVSYTTLDRLSVTSNKNHIMYRTFSEKDVMVSIRAHSNGSNCVTVTQGEWDGLVYQSQQFGNAGVAICESIVGKGFAKAQINLLASALTLPLALSNVTAYTFSPPEDPGKPYTTLAAPPLVPPAGAPTVHIDNSERAVQKRVLDKVNKTVPPHDYHGYAMEFNKLLVPEAKCTMLSFQEAGERLSKTPARKSRVMRACRETHTDAPPPIDSFGKRSAVAGAVAKGADERQIFPVEAHGLIRTAMFTLPFKEYITLQSELGENPFCTGLKPQQTADRVMAFCLRVEKIAQTDFSKMDATFFEALHEWYADAVARGFEDGEIDHPDTKFKTVHKYIKGMLRKETQRNVKVNLRNGSKPVKFNSGWMNLSGRMNTSLASTYANALIAYIAARLAGLSPEEAFASIGPSAGDDGLRDGKYDVVSVAKNLGMELKCDFINSGEPVTFLSRVYVSPHHTPTSVPDPGRALAQIPVVSGKDVLDKLAAKVHGYLTADPHCPLISDYCLALKRTVLKGIKVKVGQIDDHEISYKINQGAHPYDPAFGDAAVGVIAQCLGVEPSDVLTTIKKCTATRNSKDLDKLWKGYARLIPETVGAGGGAVPVA
jgi:hypothetical protein